MARKRKGEEQPRVISPELDYQPSKYKVSWLAEGQKFGHTQKQAKQLYLWETSLDEKIDEPIEVTGLELSVEQDKALSAVQQLLSETDYLGNKEGETVHSPDFKGTFYLPRWEGSYSEYFEAYGLVKRGGRYHGRQRNRSLQALYSLAQPFWIVYKRARGKNKAGKRLYDVIATYRPILSIKKKGKDIPEDEIEKFAQGEQLPGRAVKLEIQLGPLLVDMIESMYILKPTDLHKQIEEEVGSKRYSPAILRFINYLHWIDFRTLKLSRDSLIDILRLHSYVAGRQPARIDKIIQDSLEIAKARGFLLDYREDEIGLWELDLNSEKLGRVKAKQRRMAELLAAGEDEGEE